MCVCFVVLFGGYVYLVVLVVLMYTGTFCNHWKEIGINVYIVTHGSSLKQIFIS